MEEFGSKCPFECCQDIASNGANVVHSHGIPNNQYRSGNWSLAVSALTGLLSSQHVSD